MPSPDEHQSTYQAGDEERCRTCGVLVAYWDPASKTWVEV